MLNTVLANEKAKKSSMFVMWLERFTALEESALAVESFTTKAVQKDAISYVNRIIEHLFNVLSDESGLRAMDKSSGDAAAEAASEVYYNRPAIHTIKAWAVGVATFLHDTNGTRYPIAWAKNLAPRTGWR